MTDFKKEIAELNQEINELNQEVAELRKEIKEYKNHVKESDRFTDVITLKEKKENLLIQQKNLLLEKQLKLMAMTFPAAISNSDLNSTTPPNIWNFEKIGQELIEIRKENRETKNKLAVVLKSSESRSPTCPSISGFGQTQEEKYQKIEIPLQQNDSSYVNPFDKRDYKDDEAAFNHDIYPLFKECCSSLETSGIILVNGEDHLSLFDVNYETDSKPDFLLFHKSFFIERQKKSDGLFYGTIHHDFQNQVLCAWEGKVTNIHTYTNLGIIFHYVHIMLNLRIEKPVGLLYNQQSMVFCDGSESILYKADWNYSSINFLKERLSTLSFNFPRLTDTLVKLCNYFQVEPLIGGYCGRGSYGYCFKVVGSDGIVKVLKIVLDNGLIPSFKINCLKEYQNALEARRYY